MNVLQALSSALIARNNCALGGQFAAEHIWREVIRRLEHDCLPCGSGFDNGTQILSAQKPHLRLVFSTAFHHMDDHGAYDRWTSHRVLATATFDGFELSVNGPNHRDIKPFIIDTFDVALNQSVPKHCTFLAARADLTPAQL